MSFMINLELLSYFFHPLKIMKRILSLFVFLTIISSCSYHYKLYKVPREFPLPNVSNYDLGKGFVDSLSEIGVDTIVGYYIGCSGCISGTPKDFYVFWMKDRTPHLRFFPTWGEQRNIIKGLPYSYFYEKIDSLKNEELENFEEPFLHYGYDYVFMTIGDKKVEYELTMNLKNGNLDSYHTLFIDKIRSSVLDIKTVRIVM